MYNVDIVGTIPPGLPSPKFPRLDKLTTFEQVEDLAGVALVAAIVSFIITHSIAKSLAGATEVKRGVSYSVGVCRSRLKQKWGYGGGGGVVA